jgi:hypothetical protein
MSWTYEERLKISIEGDSTTKFFTKNGIHIATGYRRVVIGGRGPYIEFDPSNIVNKFDTYYIPDDQFWRTMPDSKAYYIEYRTKDLCNIKIYLQRKTVDYADYKIGMYYISSFDLVLEDCVHIIEPLKK